MDATYSCVSLNIHKFKLKVLNGCDIENKSTNICCFIQVMNEKYETFENIFEYPKKNYQFNRKNL